MTIPNECVESNSVECEKCNTGAATYRPDIDAYVCWACNHRWTDSTDAERAFDRAYEGATITVPDLGVELTVRHVEMMKDMIGAVGGPTDLYRLYLCDDGSAEVTKFDNGTGEWESIAEGVQVKAEGDEWSGNSSAQASASIGAPSAVEKSL